MKVSESYRKGESLDRHVSRVNDPFFKECLELINDGIMEKDHLLRLLEDRINNLNYIFHYNNSKILFKNNQDNNFSSLLLKNGNLIFSCAGQLDCGVICFRSIRYDDCAGGQQGIRQ